MKQMGNRGMGILEENIQGKMLGSWCTYDKTCNIENFAMKTFLGSVSLKGKQWVFYLSEKVEHWRVHA